MEKHEITRRDEIQSNKTRRTWLFFPRHISSFEILRTDPSAIERFPEHHQSINRDSANISNKDSQNYEGKTEEISAKACWFGIQFKRSISERWRGCLLCKDGQNNGRIDPNKQSPLPHVDRCCPGEDTRLSKFNQPTVVSGGTFEIVMTEMCFLL